MLFIYSMERYEFIFLVLAVIIIAAICYYFAVKSRKSYTCPECGEKINVEYMEARHCGMCGALLNQDNKE